MVTHKSLIILLSVAVVALSIMLAIEKTKQVQEPIDLAPIHQTRDSLTHVILATQDTLSALRHILDGKMLELVTARLNSSKTTKAHEAIHFVPLSDSARVRELSELYHTYQNP